MIVPPVVIASTGHAGTAWLATLLAFLGVAATHEGIFTLHGVKRWPDRLEADVSLAAAPHLAGLRAVGLFRTAWLARDPLLVARSFYRGRTFAAVCPCHPAGAHLGSPLAHYAARDLGVTFTDDELTNTVGYLTAALRHRQHAELTLRVEDLSVDLAPLEPLLGAGLELHAIPDPRLNAHGLAGDERAELVWEDLETVPGVEELRAHALELGYAA